jgi:L-2-hydroxycarboxylate dehydrogenase (NAD+)
MAAEAGCVGMSGTNARPSIAPTFGVEPMLGTNPLCFGVPTDDGFPFCIDCATSVNQRGKIEKYQRMGLATPKGCVIDEEGNERTDTDGILRDMQFGEFV